MAELSYTLLRLLPKNTFSRAVGAACRVHAPRPVLRAVIRAFAKKYGVDASEAKSSKAAPTRRRARSTRWRS